ncbi:hypothetical protein G7Y89_g3893 [Cudoniella acicularis]|uniref:Dihydrofolate reductase n=1 Tax=Cudoniella acicularis TaxID=354080 RepID=A0A8H4RTH4_9HELO|nr:hypothetical protein G7Y89_g3893 [Cudoniella acicularis]
MTSSTTPATSHDPTMPPRELTLIVAATSKMGIGLRGTLPWTGLKKEMAYFARVTKRAPSLGATNAVIMGRKTWDSIPPRFRPLKERHNIVISRTLPPASKSSSSSSTTVSSLSEALDTLSRPTDAEKASGRAFIIGGAQIYATALEKPETKRILLTRILSDFECDTFFPVVLEESGEAGSWRRRSKEELDAWVGENVADGEQEEGGTRPAASRYPHCHLNSPFPDLPLTLALKSSKSYLKIQHRNGRFPLGFPDEIIDVIPAIKLSRNLRPMVVDDFLILSVVGPSFKLPVSWYVVSGSMVCVAEY